MPRKKEIPGGVLTARDVKGTEPLKANEGERDSQSLTLLQLTPSERPRGWRKIYGRIAARADGEIFVNPAILGPWAGLCAFIDGVAACVESEPIFVPVSWAIQEYPQHAEHLKTLVGHIHRALQTGGSN